MSARSKARKRALDLIFAAEARGQGAVELLEEQTAAGEAPVNEHTVALVRAVAEHQGRIDEVVAGYAQGWTLQRMPAVDRNLLRLGSAEILYFDDVPDAVAISEAVNLARELSTDESPNFVNGVLGQIARDKAELLSA